MSISSGGEADVARAFFSKPVNLWDARVVRLTSSVPLQVQFAHEHAGGCIAEGVGEKGKFSDVRQI